jgi:hypothetical protein
VVRGAARDGVAKDARSVANRPRPRTNSLLPLTALAAQNDKRGANDNPEPYFSTK